MRRRMMGFHTAGTHTQTFSPVCHVLYDAPIIRMKYVVVAVAVDGVLVAVAVVDVVVIGRCHQIYSIFITFAHISIFVARACCLRGPLPTPAPVLSQPPPGHSAPAYVASAAAAAAADVKDLRCPAAPGCDAICICHAPPDKPHRYTCVFVYACACVCCSNVCMKCEVMILDELLVFSFVFFVYVLCLCCAIDVVQLFIGYPIFFLWFGFVSVVDLLCVILSMHAWMRMIRIPFQCKYIVGHTDWARISRLIMCAHDIKARIHVDEGFHANVPIYMRVSMCVLYRLVCTVVFD